MPGKEELFSKLLFLIQSPAQRLATVINATGRDLAVVINQAVEKDKFAGVRRCRSGSCGCTCAELQHPCRRSRLQPKRLRSPSRRVAADARRSSLPQTEQPENGTASQAGEAANTDPVEG